MRSALTTTLIALCTSCLASGQARADTVALIATSGTPLRIAIDETIPLTAIGQEVHGTLVEPLYAYDRLVLPAGARVTGHVASLADPSKRARLRAWSTGDFSPNRRATIQFDAIMDDGHRIALNALGVNGIANVRRRKADDPSKPSVDEDRPTGLASRTRQEAQQKVRESIASAKARANDTLSMIKEPGKKERFKYLLLNQLPYHHQYLAKGTVYDARLMADVSFGAVDASTPAPSGTRPAPLSVLRARIATPLDSGTTRKGARIEAIVIQPVLSSDGLLIVPQGTRLTGEVTAATPARRLHRNGQLRFLFESVELPDQGSVPLLASLHSADVSADAGIAIDEEGGAVATSSKTRFIAPSLAILALRGSLDHHEHLDPDGDGHMIQSGHPGASGTGGFLGLGLVGTVIGPMWRPAGVALSLVGVARTTYKNILGKGQEVRFTEDTPIELQLAPGPSPVP
jgi:hypothetical protein